MKILLHICCGPCGVYPVQDLLKASHQVTGYYFNPNIHPYQEYARRLEGAQEMARRLDVPIFVASQYHPESYFREVDFRESERCRYCYELRLCEVARQAKDQGFDGFTSTLLVSPWQKHDLLHDIGDLVGSEHGIPFLYYDWRSGFSEGRRVAKEMGLYRQQYCGCLYSEQERYDPQLQKKREW
jgi:predicted adenine nucleotide alpha hydrolase (AANH) superfamily ATPase